ncbi:olfactory receptor 52B2-like [Symphorus nematophorus]
MYTNASSAVLLTLETLGLSKAYVYPAFLFGTLTYLSIMFCNLLVLATIACSKKLHKPMFILLFNLPISDMVGATAFFPQLLISIVTQNRLISHPACITQALLVHFYGVANLLILSAMAYDRYVAICCPLRYNAIMTPHNLVRIIILIWVLDFSLILILMLLLVRFKICRTNIVDLYCNNPSLVKLVCEDTRVNNYYGLFTIALFQGGPLLTLLYTYGQILRTCVLTNQPDARRKAIQTCGSHLTVYLILEINTFITLLAHRIGSVSPFLRRALGVSVLIFPPFLDPIIYGLKTRELKQGINILLKRNVGSSEL